MCRLAKAIAVRMNDTQKLLVSITITNCRQTHGTERNSHTTITRHQEDKLSKAASPLSRLQNKNGRKVTQYRTITESCNGSNNQQRISNNRITSLEQTAAYISGVLKLHFTGTKYSPQCLLLLKHKKFKLA